MLPISRYHYTFLALSLTAALMVACSQQRKLMESAQKMEEAGMLQSALIGYTDVYKAYESVDAKIAQRRVTQQLLNVQCQQALSMCMSGKINESFKNLQEARNFYEANKHLEINFPAQSEQQIAQCKKEYVSNLVAETQEAILDLDFDRGENLVDEIYSLDYDNKQVKGLALLLQIVPVYNEGQKALDIELWRQAYDSFNKVCTLDASYRDAKANRDLALMNGRIALAYLIKDGNAPEKVEQSLASQIKGEVLALKNPFIELLERSDLDVLIQEQQNSLGAEYDSEKGPLAGRFQRANYLLYGEVINYKVTAEPERSVKCDCGVKLNIHSDKVECFEITQKRQVEMSFRFQLVNAETGKIYLADVFHEKLDDFGARYDFTISKKLSLMSPTFQKDHDVDL
jgi:hypothetical protein